MKGNYGTPESIQLKLSRAKEHYDAFVSEARRHLDAYSGKLMVEMNLASNTFNSKFEGDHPFPPRLSMIMGDCLVNARSCLDYLVWELVLGAGGQPTKRHSFPICETLDSFVKASKSRFDGLSPEIIAEIELLQPYHLGKDYRAHAFWALDELCNINKHRRILMATVKPGILRPIPGTDRYTALPSGRAGQMKVNDEIVAYVGFEERGFENTPDVSAILAEIMRSIEVVIPNFYRFLR